MQEKIKPFVKWAGGKGCLLNQIRNYYPSELVERKNRLLYRAIYWWWSSTNRHFTKLQSKRSLCFRHKYRLN